MAWCHPSVTIRVWFQNPDKYTAICGPSTPAERHEEEPGDLLPAHGPVRLTYAALTIKRPHFKGEGREQCPRVSSDHTDSFAHTHVLNAWMHKTHPHTYMVNTSKKHTLKSSY